MDSNQLAVFHDPHRDEGGWVLSVFAPRGSVDSNQLAAFDDPHRDEADGCCPWPTWPSSRMPHWWKSCSLTPDPVPAGPVSWHGPLPDDHPAIVRAAKKGLRRRYADRPDPDRLLGSRFSIRELQDIHAAIAGTALQKDTRRSGDVERRLAVA